ncbi:4-hydroxy-tetrahydrodipicolinate synthase [Aquicella siphonis]|uniref:4-hydroxy-tetrahydrodipicolinate synthase n=1 Tax=Aquicella siphonis TaxID=254247 RepID=A0A5E4PJ25_9COXI|nr:4-hydroxy-tetrahydrodipicolinate synthase [Aquicella siphonis]VVC76306.1 4-hydroxy-tetrahydrodipicolinate synthase [Aquicella siphonis]
MFKGSMVAIVTPMHNDGSIDKKALQELTEWHIGAGTDAIIAAGTTGESATLEPDEQFEVISLIVRQAAGRIPVIAGSGTNSTRTTIRLSENARRAGADACLIVTPYYNKPTQNGLYAHYEMVMKQVDMPVILYNVPGRTACDLLPETVERLSQIKNILGIKEATGKVERAAEIIRRCGNTFAVYSGDDATALDLMLAGAQGVISVTANVAPQKMHAMCTAALGGNMTLAAQINDELMLLHKNLFLESNPIPAKWALAEMGKIQAGIRMPLLPLDSQYHQDVKKAMQNAGVK